MQKYNKGCQESQDYSQNATEVDQRQGYFAQMCQNTSIQEEEKVEAELK